MAYTGLTDRTDAGPLIPEDVARAIIQGLPAESVALANFRRATMSRAQQRMPVLSVLPTAYWVGEAARKQTTEQNWDNLYLDARELAVIVPIPEAVLDDSDYDIWGEIRPRLIEAFGAKIDAAALFGTDSPSGWPDSIVEQAVTAGNERTIGDAAVYSNATTPDFSVEVSETMALVEDDGFDVNAFWGRRNLRARLRGLRDDTGQPIFQPSLQAGTPATLYGEALTFVSNGSWDPAEALICGDRSAAIIAVRQDISYKIFTEGVISDDSGVVVLNLMQQDAVALRATMRVAYQVANAINLENTNASTRFPFAVLHEAGS
jgi:HK97 family phage major capsid protein